MIALMPDLGTEAAPHALAANWAAIFTSGSGVYDPARWPFFCSGLATWVAYFAGGGKSITVISPVCQSDSRMT